MDSEETQTVIGFCPQQYVTAADYLFVEVAGVLEPKSNRWLKVPNPTTVFPPKGTIFVPQHLIPEFFDGQPECAAAWTVVDQPDWAEVGIGARYRARALASCPAEIVNVPCPSTDCDATRRLLLYDGVDHAGGVQGRESLIKFTDEILAGPLRLIAKAGVAHRYYCTEATLSNPIPAWESTALDLCRLASKGAERVFFAKSSPFPEADFYLDYASLEVAIGRTQLNGGTGIGSGAALVNAKSLAKQVTQVLAAYPNSAIFNARRDRLATLIDSLSQADRSWESWLLYIRQHSRFQEAVDSALSERMATLEQEVRSSLVEKERQLLDQITEFEQMAADAEKQVRILDDEISRRTEERELLNSEVTRLQGDLDNFTKAKSGDESPLVTASYSHPSNDQLPCGHSWSEFTSSKAIGISSPEQAISHLQENFSRAGLLPSPCLQLAREVFSAASLGQALLFSGSFASQVSEIIAISLSGCRWRRLGVELGVNTPLSLPPPQENDQIGAIILEGINRSCFDAYGGEVARLLGNRALGLHSGGSPIVIGTIQDGPSCLPPGGTLAQLGLNCNTDLLSWKPRRGAITPIEGTCTEQSLKSDAVRFTVRIPDSISRPTLSVHWHRNITSAGELLSAFDREQALISLLCGWVIPYLSELGINTLPSEFVDEFELVLGNPRVHKHLGSCGIEVVV